MNMENELPKIDLTEDVLVDVLTDSVILNLYAHFPCRIKAEILVLCKKGDIDTSINLVDYHVSDNSFLVVLPGSIFQVNQIRGDVEIYFAGFFRFSAYDQSGQVAARHYLFHQVQPGCAAQGGDGGTDRRLFQAGQADQRAFRAEQPGAFPSFVLLPHLCHQLAVQQPQDGYGQPLACRTDQPGFRTAGARQLYQREECGFLCQ